MSASQFSTGSVVKYALLPQVLPRFYGLFLSGFAHLAYLMAQIYRGVRLLPDNHPFLLPANIGRFGIRQVIAAAAAQLKFRRENIDQVIVFFALLLGMVLLAGQVFLMLLGMVSTAAHAASPLSFGWYFGDPNFGPAGSAQDLAFILLDRVFGVPGIFNSCISLLTPCYNSLPNMQFDIANPLPIAPAFPWPYHDGLHAMFEFYSTGLLVVATFIIIYFVIVIIAETAQTGTPFGKRFNSVWAPLRLVMALGLLIPISNGLNSAQYITLWMAKFGSNFATNGWVVFNSGVTAWSASQAAQLVAKPNAPEADGLLQFMMLAHACKALEEGYYLPRDVENDDTRSCNIPQDDDGYRMKGDGLETFIDGYLVRFSLSNQGINTDSLRLSQTDYVAARQFFNNGDMTIRFGDRACENTIHMGRVEPTCGEVVIPMVNPSTAVSEVAAVNLQADYYEVVRYLWGEYPAKAAGGGIDAWRYLEFCNENDTARFINGGALNGDIEIRRRAIAYVQKEICKLDEDQLSMYGPQGVFVATLASLQPVPPSDWKADAAMHYSEGAGAASTAWPAMVAANGGYPGAVTHTNMPMSSAGACLTPLIAENSIRIAVSAQTEVMAGMAPTNACAGNAGFSNMNLDEYEMSMDQLQRGWAGAGMWYNHIARVNGSLLAAASNYPQPSRYPKTMETVLAKLRQNNQNLTAEDQFNPNMGKDRKIPLERPNETKAAEALNEIYRYWGTNGNLHKPPTGNAIYDFINELFGTKGLFSLDDPKNAQTHPLALLSALGKSLVEASIRNIGVATFVKGGGVLSGLVGFTPGEVGANAISSFLFSIATVTLTAGIVLYYVLPFLPFIYFFFAVGNWVKGIFEAMVGVPLWALAHIRIDGNGLPGEAAMNGYYMIFEIFLRPLLIVFGLLASVTIYAAMASVLNGIWPLATKNLSGANYDLATSPGWVQSARGPIDQLFFTVMYAVILYIMGLSSFKLIDLIPNQIMRWLGTGVSTFSDLTGDAAAQLTQTTTVVGQQMTSQAIGGLRSGLDAAGNMAEGVKNMASKKP